MNKKEAAGRIARLRKTINHHRYLYHVLDRQEISDAALDSLKHELKKLEDQYPDLITPDSPTQRVGGEALKQFKKVTHHVPMISLEDVFSAEEFEQWMARTQKLLPHNTLLYFAELKIDGFAISLIYRRGLFVLGSTRGNGKIGEEVTQNLKTIEAIPLRLVMPEQRDIERIGLSYAAVRQAVEEGEFEIRGEVYLSKKEFLAINHEREKEGLPLYANPRNTAAGSIRQLDPRIAAGRNLSFLAYDVVTDVGQEFHSQEHMLAQLLGFRTDGVAEQCADAKAVEAFHKKISDHREKLPYQIDGVVVNVDSNALFARLGVAGKAPRGAVAFKFPPMQATTRVRDIQVQVGRTGILTPVAILDPVAIGGATVSRSTLHNLDEIRRLDVRIGDTVIVERSGDVIPKVIAVIASLRPRGTKEFRMPRKCPVDGSPVVRKDGEVYYRCSNPQCGAQEEGRIEHFTAKSAMDIKGLGPKIIQTFIDSNLIRDPADLYDLTIGDIKPLERFAEKSAENIIAAIDRSRRDVELWRFINALGIMHVGEETAVGLEEHFKTAEAIMAATDEQLREIPDIGPKVAESITKWFAQEKNRKLFVRLLRAIHLKVLRPRVAASQSLYGKTFVVTGTLENFSREEAKEAIRARGGNVAESVSARTSYVVVGSDPGSKYAKAQTLHIPIVSEKEFKKMLEKA